AEFHGRAEIDRDPSTWSGTIQGAGQDARSSSATRGVIRYHLLPGDAGSTRVALTVGYTLTGPLAQFGRSGLVREIASSLTKTFAQNLEARLAAPDGAASPASELNATRLMLSALTHTVRSWWRALVGR